MAKRAHIELSDGINVLPDELLVSILGFLSLKEAVATSILCHRWRHLWTFTNKLDFDGLNFFRKIWSRMEGYECAKINFVENIWSVSKNLEESWNYIAWVNSILGFHQGSSIDEFRIDFFLAEAHKKHIDRWLRFVSAKKVKRLELNLRWKIYCHYEGYALPYELLMNFKHLRSLRLQWVNVSGECLELILGACPLLEELAVYYSKPLTTLKIIGPYLALKRLEIVQCEYLTLLEIRDVNLVFFMYHGELLRQFVLKNVPHLVEMDLGGHILKNMKDFLLMFSSYLPQLEKLTMFSFGMYFLREKSAKKFYNKMKMSNLQQLEFKIWGLSCNLEHLIYIMCTAPMLQSLVIQSFNEEEMQSSPCDESRVPRNFYRYCHLKRVEFIGYRGTRSQQYLAYHLLKSGAALEEFVIDLRVRDNIQEYFNLFWPNIIHGWISLGYPNIQEDEINAAKADVRQQFAKTVLATHQHLHLTIP